MALVWDQITQRSRDPHALVWDQIAQFSQTHKHWSVSRWLSSNQTHTALVWDQITQFNPLGPTDMALVQVQITQTDPTSSH